MSLSQQADLIGLMLSRTKKINGESANETWMLIDAMTVKELRSLQRRLTILAAHEPAIKKMLAGRR